MPEFFPSCTRSDICCTGAWRDVNFFIEELFCGSSSAANKQRSQTHCVSNLRWQDTESVWNLGHRSRTGPQSLGGPVPKAPAAVPHAGTQPLMPQWLPRMPAAPQGRLATSSSFRCGSFSICQYKQKEQYTRLVEFQQCCYVVVLKCTPIIYLKSFLFFSTAICVALSGGKV